MKLSEILKKLGLNIDEEIELPEENKKETKKETLDVNKDNKKEEIENENKTPVVETKKSEETKKVEEVKEDAVVELIFNEKTGLFDTKGITDANVKAVLEKANAYTINTANQVKIDKAFEEKIAGLKIRKGITTDAIRALVKMDGIKVENDKVVGIDEAFETLQKEQSGLFVQRNQSESNPMLEGFNPAQSNGSTSSDALTASLAALSASLANNNNN